MAGAAGAGFAAAGYGNQLAAGFLKFFEGGPKTPPYYGPEFGPNGVPALNAERAGIQGTQASVSEGAFLTNSILPYIFNQAGFDVTTAPQDTTSQTNLANASTALANARGMKKGTKGRGRDLRQARKGYRRALNASSAAATGPTVTSITPRGFLGTPQDNQIDLAMKNRIQAGLAGRIGDPTLNASLAAKSDAQRAYLQSVYGPGYADTSAGSAAISAMDTSNAEVAADFSRNDALSFLPAESNFETSLANLAGEKINLATAGPNAAFSAANAWAGVTSSVQPTLKRGLDERMFKAGLTNLADLSAYQGKENQIAGLNQIAQANYQMGGALGAASQNPSSPSSDPSATANPAPYYISNSPAPSFNPYQYGVQ